MLPNHDRLVAALGDPDTVLLLLALGVIAVCIELSRGGILPGVTGAVLIVLALGSPAARNFDVTGSILVAVSFLCFVLEGTLRTRGLLTLVGAGSMIYGLLKIDKHPGWIVVVAAVLFAILISFLLSVAAAARRNKLGILKNGDGVKP